MNCRRKVIIESWQFECYHGNDVVLERTYLKKLAFQTCDWIPMGLFPHMLPKLWLAIWISRRIARLQFVYFGFGMKKHTRMNECPYYEKDGETVRKRSLHFARLVQLFGKYFALCYFMWAAVGISPLLLDTFGFQTHSTVTVMQIYRRTFIYFPLVFTQMCNNLWM